MFYFLLFKEENKNCINFLRGKNHATKKRKFENSHNLAFWNQQDDASSLTKQFYITLAELYRISKVSKKERHAEYEFVKDLLKIINSSKFNPMLSLHKNHCTDQDNWNDAKNIKINFLNNHLGQVPLRSIAFLFLHEILTEETAYQLMEALLKKGADADWIVSNARTANSYDKNGEKIQFFNDVTPLFIVRESVMLLELLLKYGTDPNFIWHSAGGTTILHYITEGYEDNYTELHSRISLLLNYGARSDIPNEENQEPFDQLDQEIFDQFELEEKQDLYVWAEQKHSEYLEKNSAFISDEKDQPCKTSCSFIKQ